MTGFVETFRGVVYPWDCDHLGHMNVKNYVGMFDQGAFHILSMMGFGSADMHDVGATLVDAQHTIKYLIEQPVGSLIRVESAVTRLGNKSIVVLHRMWNTETNEMGATSEVVSVYFDLKSRKSLPIPDAIRDRIKPFVVENPEG
ncbi:MAG: thioesterase family protein [Alphaproteobacteria bacterium]